MLYTVTFAIKVTATGIYKYFRKGNLRKMTPKFSIVTITFNSEKTLKETLESVLCQKYRPLEYLIVDGGSTDHTLQILETYADKFRSVGIDFLVKSEKDRGISDAFNKGIQRASGDIIGIINSDDMLYEDAVGSVAENYAEEFGVYHGQCVMFNDEGPSQFLAVPKTDMMRLNREMCIYHPATFVTKQTYERWGGFDVDLKYCMDRELLLKFRDNGVQFKYIERPLAYYREGGVNQINYGKNLLEGARISIRYGVSTPRAYMQVASKYLRYLIWRAIQRLGLEGVFHKKLTNNAG